MTIDAVGGVFTYALDLIRGLRSEGVSVSVVVLGRAMSADQRSAMHDAGPLSCHEPGFRLEWEEDPWADLARAGKWLLALERDERPDVVHSNSYFCGALAWRAPCLVVAHSCVCSWWEAVHGVAAPAAWDRYRSVVAEGLRGADGVVAPSQAMLSSVGRLYGPLGGQARVIHNGSSSPLACGPVAKEAFALAAGRAWDEAKNLRVLERVSSSGPLLVFGPGSARGPLPVSELAALRRRAAVFVAPAFYEPFGLGVLEAARDACALVLGDIESLRELWGEAAVYVPPRDPSAIAAAVEDLLASPERAASLGRLAQERARRYSAASMARGYARLYRTLVDTRLCRRFPVSDRETLAEWVPAP